MTCASALLGLAVLGVVPHVPASTTPRCARSAPRMMATRVGSTIIAGSSLPASGIFRAQSYVLRRVYYQGEGDGAGGVERVDVDTIEAPPPDGCAGFTKYVLLFSAAYHDAPVVVSPREVKIRSVRDEVVDSVRLALPGLVWAALAFAIFQYGESHGGVFRGFDRPQ